MKGRRKAAVRKRGKPAQQSAFALAVRAIARATHQSEPAARRLALAARREGKDISRVAAGYKSAATKRRAKAAVKRDTLRREREFLQYRQQQGPVLDGRDKTDWYELKRKASLHTPDFLSHMAMATRLGQSRQEAYDRWFSPKFQGEAA